MAGARAGTGGPLRGSLGTGTKASIESSPFFGGIGGKAITTPGFSFGEGGLSRTNTEFLDESRRTLSDLRAGRTGFGGGISEFRRARLQDVENARARTTGNLRSQLGRRGILGASFAQDAITRTELDFQQQADKVAAEIDVQEFEFNLASLAQESGIIQANLTRDLNELGHTLQFVSGINSAIVERDRIAASLTIAAMQAAASNRSRRTSVTTLGGRLSGPGGPLGSFQFGSPSGGFRGSTTGAAEGLTSFTNQGATITPFKSNSFTPTGFSGSGIDSVGPNG